MVDLNFFTKDQFTKYLSNYPANCVIGYRHEPNYCPISIFVSEMINVDDHIQLFVNTSYDNLEVIGNNSLVLNERLPKWAVNFASKVDDQSDDHPVTADQALRVLSSIED